MRRHNKVVLMAMLGVLVFSALASASASAALPEFQKEGHPLAETVKFSGTSNEISYEMQIGSTYSCRVSAITGEITNSTEVANVILKFGECSTQTGACRKAGTHELVSTPLKGRIGYLKKAEAKEVGLLLEPTSQMFAECKISTEGEVRELRGSLIGAVSPINTAGTSFTSLYAKGAKKGTNVLSHFEGEEVMHSLELYRPLEPKLPPESVGLQAKLPFTTTKSIEIKA